MIVQCHKEPFRATQIPGQLYKCLLLLLLFLLLVVLMVVSVITSLVSLNNKQFSHLECYHLHSPSHHNDHHLHQEEGKPDCWPALPAGAGRLWTGWTSLQIVTLVVSQIEVRNRQKGGNFIIWISCLSSELLPDQGYSFHMQGCS